MVQNNKSNLAINQRSGKRIFCEKIPLNCCQSRQLSDIKGVFILMEGINETDRYLKVWVRDLYRRPLGTNSDKFLAPFLRFSFDKSPGYVLGRSLLKVNPYEVLLYRRPLALFHGKKVDPQSAKTIIPFLLCLWCSLVNFNPPNNARDFPPARIRNTTLDPCQTFNHF